MSDRLARYGISENTVHAPAEQLQHDEKLFVENLHEMGITQANENGSEALVYFSQAAISDYNNEKVDFPEFREVVKFFIESRTDMDAAYKVQHFWRAIHAPLLKQDRSDYPDSKEKWQAWFREALRDTEQSENIKSSLDTRNNQATEPRRYAGLKLAFMMNKLILPPSPTLVEAGCSAGLGLVQMIKGVPFENVTFNTEIPEVRTYLQEQLLGKLAVGPFVGFDSQQIDQATIEWVEACSYHPRELKDEKRREFRKQLYKMRKELAIAERYGGSDELMITLANLVAPEEGEDDGIGDVRNLLEDGKADVSAALTTVYEIEDNKQAEALDNLGSLSRYFDYVQDFSFIQNDDPTKLVFPGIYKTPYRAFIRYKADTSQRWHQLGEWDNGRCRIFTPSDFLIRLCHKTMGRNQIDNQAELYTYTT